jgi:hypothetical protein
VYQKAFIKYKWLIVTGYLSNFINHLHFEGLPFKTEKSQIFGFDTPPNHIYLRVKPGVLCRLSLAKSAVGTEQIIGKTFSKNVS